MSITGLTAGELLAKMEQGELTCRTVTEAHLDRITALDESIGAFLLVDHDGALAQAVRIDEKRARGEPVGILGGLPVAIKDVVCVKGQKTTCASRMLRDFKPPYDGHIVSRLRAQDAVLIGKTNMDEFAMGSSSENSAFRPVKNPWDLRRTPGGSSGGSAAAVAAQMVPLAVGSDTGGSIRQPAAYCGVTGMKPTYGRVSRYGLIAYGSSLDQLGPIANDVYGAALLLEAIAGHDPRDSTCVNTPVPAYSRTVDVSLAGLRIGLVRDHFIEGLDPEIERAVLTAVDVYRSIGVDVEEVGLPNIKYSVAAYYLIAPSEASSNLARYDGVHYGMRAAEFDDMIDMYAKTRGEGFGDEVKRRIMLGAYALSAGYYDQYYLKALKVRRLIHRDFDEAFSQVDVLMGPVTPRPAFRLGEFIDDPLAMYLTDTYTIGANLAGIPAISNPAGLTESGLPIGVQFLAPPFKEERLLRSAAMFERETDWHSRRAPLN